MKKSIWANMVVRNEENFVWFSVMSVINFVDKILIYDLGSTDKTVKIIKTIKSKKIILHEEPANKDLISHANARQKMLDETKSDWLLILDGDEIWPDESIKRIIKEINANKNCEMIVMPTIMLLGDFYHFQEEKGGMYEIAGRKGHLNLRAIKKVPGLHIEIHKTNNGLLREGFYNSLGKLIYEKKEKVTFLDTPYLHASYLRRSSKDGEVIERVWRYKYELGEDLLSDFKYPSCFYIKRPDIVVSPWGKVSFFYNLRAFIETPLKKLKRRLF